MPPNVKQLKLNLKHITNLQKSHVRMQIRYWCSNLHNNCHTVQTNHDFTTKVILWTPRAAN